MKRTPVVWWIAAVSALLSFNASIAPQYIDAINALPQSEDFSRTKDSVASSGDWLVVGSPEGEMPQALVATMRT